MSSRSYHSLVERGHSDFSQADVMWAPLSGSGALGWGAWLGVDTSHFSDGAPTAEIRIQHPSCCPWEHGQSFLHLYLPTSPNVASVSPWL